MAKAKKLQTNWSAGEFSPRIEGRPDLAKFFNGASILENYLIYPQGGIYAAPGTRFVAETKDSSKKSILVPFIRSRQVAYYLEFGHLYVRFYKGRGRIEVASVPVEVVTPYTESDLPDLEFEQSVDVLFIDHPSYQTRKLNRLSDISWTITTLQYRPPPSQELPQDYSGGTITLTPGATTGSGITFTASAAVFLKGDEDREITFGVSRAIITAFVSTTDVTCDIIDDFPNTNPIAAGSWFVVGTPSSFINPNKKKLRAKVTVVGETDAGANQNTFRSTDKGKFIKVYGGVIEITGFTSATTVTGVIRVALSIWTGKADGTAPNNPDTTPLWTLEDAIWNSTKGFPATLAFYQNRLFHGKNTQFVGSQSDGYENYGVGAQADDAVQYTIISRQLNEILWFVDLGPLFIGTPGGVYMAKASGVDNPLGGDSIPLVRAQNMPGSIKMRPALVGTTGIYVNGGEDASTLTPNGRRVFDITYNFDDNTYRGTDLTKFADHICGDSGFKADNIAYQDLPNRHFYLIRNDGQIAALTYYRLPEDVVGWARRTTDGIFESICSTPHVDGGKDMISAIVQRTINSATKRYVEIMEDNAPEMSTRAWKQGLADCAVFYSGAAITTITGAGHLEAKSVDVIADGVFKGQKTVASGQFTLDVAASKIEYGLHYESAMTTMRPAIQDAIIEGMQRKWSEVFLRVRNTIGANVNGQEMIFNVGGQPLDAAPPLFTGDKRIIAAGGWSTDGRITVKRTQPYPQEILALFGNLEVGDT